MKWKFKKTQNRLFRIVWDEVSEDNKISNTLRPKYYIWSLPPCPCCGEMLKSDFYFIEDGIKYFIWKCKCGYRYADDNRRYEQK